MRRSFAFLPVLLLLVAAPLTAQDPQTPADTIVPAPALPAPGDTAAPAMPAPAPTDTAAATPAPAPPATAPTDTAQATPGHDWEFSLNPASRAPGASGAVQVTSGEPENRFVVAVSGLPPIESLDAEEFDAEVYTVWVVPAKDRVPESTLAGVLVLAVALGVHFGARALQASRAASVTPDAFAAVQLEQMRSALDLYRRESGSYPRDLQALVDDDWIAATQTQVPSRFWYASVYRAS